MSNNDFVNLAPRKRIAPFDGMAVTAETWDEAHAYHRRALALHTAFAHAPGILLGLEVIAGDPPDRQVYVQPGIAIDAAGRTIIVPEARAYDLRASRGLVYLILSDAESQPRTAPGQTDDDAPRYIFSEYTLEASSTLPATPFVELARLRRQDAASTLRNATDAEHPGPDEIDLRYRRQVEPAPPLIPVAVSYVGMADHRHGGGVSVLARALRTCQRAQLCVDDDIPLTAALIDYTVLCLVGGGAFRLTSDEMKAIYEFLRQGGVLFYESCHAVTAGGEPEGDAAFLDLLASMGVSLETPTPGHALLTTPHFFAAPPEGYEVQGQGKLLVREGVVFSTFDYGCLWQGKRRGRAAARHEIRNALEWGENLMLYAWQRRRKAK